MKIINFASKKKNTILFDRFFFSISVPNYKIKKEKEFFLIILLEGGGDGLGRLGDGVLGEVGGEDEADGGLDLGGADGRLLVGTDEGASLGSDLVEHVIDEGVEDLDRLGGEGEALLGVLVDAVDEGVELAVVTATTGTSLLGGSLSSLGHFWICFW